MKDLDFLKKYTKNQEVSYNLRLGFAPSNRPHLHRAYEVTVCNQNFIAVFAMYALRHTVTCNLFPICMSYGMNVEYLFPLGEVCTTTTMYYPHPSTFPGKNLFDV